MFWALAWQRSAGHSLVLANAYLSKHHGGLSLTHVLSEHEQPIAAPGCQTSPDMSACPRSSPFQLKKLGSPPSAHSTCLPFCLLSLTPQPCPLPSSPQQTLAEYERYQAQIAAAQETLRTQYGKDAKWALIMPGIALLNMSVFVSQFSAVKTLADEGLPSMTNEGIAWFADLTLPDPYYGLPVLCAALTLAMVESGAMSAEMGQAQTAQTLKWVMRFFALIFIPLGAYMPSAVALLWFSNSIFSLAQASVLRSKVLRHKLGLPDLAAMQAAAAAAAAGPPSPIMQKINELMGTPAAQGATSSTGSGASGSSSGGAAAAAAAGVVSKSSSGGSAPPPPGTRPSRLLTNKPAGWKRKKA